MFTPIKFFMPGIARPAGSKSAFGLKSGGKYTGRFVVVDACKKSKNWKNEVNWAAKPFTPKTGLLQGPLCVKMIFQIQRPAGHYGSGKNSGQVKASANQMPVVKPDVLKLARAVEDGMTGIIYRDDSQIVTEILAKRYVHENPGVQIEISRASEADEIPENLQLGI
jgi:Holliday junction resolvase RusA-like endonuclease